MKNEDLDPRRQQLVAALYGELTEEEEARFQALLAEDPELRSEWEEMVETRLWLKEGVREEPAPSFILTPAGASPGAEEARSPRPRFSRAGFAAWGFAGVAALLVVLVVAGLRVDRLDQGFAVRFGPSPEERPFSASGSDDPSPTLPAGGGSSAVTRADLDTYASGMMEVMAALLADREKRQRKELGTMFQAFYEEIELQRKRDMEDLRSQVQGVGLGLMAEQSRTNARLARILDSGPPQAAPASLKPGRTVGDTPRQQEKEKNHE